MSYRAVDARPSRPRRRWHTALGAAALTALLTACSSSGSSQGDTITFGTVTPTANVINLLVAKDEGMFAKYHINLQVKNLSSSTTVMNNLGKDYDIGTGFPPAEIEARGKGLNVVIISGGTYDDAQHPGTDVVVPKDSGINNLADLQGKTVGCVGLTDAIWQGFQYQLKKSNVDKSKIKGVVVPSAAQQAQLTANKINAAVGTEPFIHQMQAAGMVTLGDPLRAVGDHVALTNVVADAGWAAKNPDLVSRFRKALDEANQWIAANPRQLVPLLAKYSGQSEAATAAAPLPGYTTSFSQTDFDQWDTVLNAVSSGNKPVTYQQLAPGLS